MLRCVSYDHNITPMVMELINACVSVCFKVHYALFLLGTFTNMGCMALQRKRGKNNGWCFCYTTHYTALVLTPPKEKNSKKVVLCFILHALTLTPLNLTLTYSYLMYPITIQNANFFHMLDSKNTDFMAFFAI